MEGVMSVLIKNGHIFTAVDSYVADIRMYDGKIRCGGPITWLAVSPVHRQPHRNAMGFRKQAAFDALLPRAVLG